jgi:hypothetical protein
MTDFSKLTDTELQAIDHESLSDGELMQLANELERRAAVEQEHADELRAQRRANDNDRP